MSAFDKITLRTSQGDTAQVVAYGAHVTSWCTADGVEQLYLSPRSTLQVGAAIRGGVPIIFPQFSMEGPLPRHGFARTAQWLPEVGRDPAAVAFAWRDDAYTRSLWPHAFAARYAVALAPRELRLTLCIDNTGDQAFTFTSALHTYFRVSDIEQVQVEGLGGAPYRDSAGGGVMRTQAESHLRIRAEVDRIYMNAAEFLTLHDGPQRRLQLHQAGFNDTVVWNPGAQKCGALKDMPADGYRHMLCIEAARIGQPITLPSGQRWCGTQRMQLQVSIP